ncbi:sensor histidine kinase [Pelagibacterium luteolum]|uniref:sensor histidine kinase n=1 Tax=Pelagibacterium luteolum TaxID=440168 RepID=UPI0015A025D3|nr:PAS domain-containing sensor histidine kinase [Pelagibacterium luteolum]
MRALSRTPVSLSYQNRDLIYEWVENLPHGIESVDVLGATDAEFLPRLAAERLRAVKLHVMETRDPQRFELPVNLAGEVRWFDIWVDPDVDGDGAALGVYSTVIDVTAQKRKEVQLKNLLREVSHRSRNLLAIVLSLASQTARSANSIPSFVASFSGRLQAIARAQDLVTDRDWQGALLSDLISRQIALFHQDHSLPVSVKGDDLVVSPSAALYVGLAIHELAANAVRNGQLQAQGADIIVAFNLDPRPDGGRTLVVKWSEKLGVGSVSTPVEPLTRKFLESVVPLAVEGSGTLDVTPLGVQYVLNIDGNHIT